MRRCVVCVLLALVFALGVSSKSQAYPPRIVVGVGVGPGFYPPYYYPYPYRPFGVIVPPPIVVAPPPPIVVVPGAIVPPPVPTSPPVVIPGPAPQAQPTTAPGQIPIHYRHRFRFRASRASAPITATISGGRRSTPSLTTGWARLLNSHQTPHHLRVYQVLSQLFAGCHWSQSGQIHP